MSTVHLSGTIDHQTSPAARQRLITELGRDDALVIDMAGVTWVDSAGLAILVEVYGAARRTGRTVHLANVGVGVMKKIRLAHLDRVFSLSAQTARPTLH